MRISSKGQITIPQHLRKQHGLLPYTDVILETNESGEIVLRKNHQDSKRGLELIEHLKRQIGLGMTTDEIMTLTRS